MQEKSALNARECILNVLVPDAYISQKGTARIDQIHGIYACMRDRKDHIEHMRKTGTKW